MGPRLVGAAAAVLAAGYAWWATGLRPFTDPAYLAILAPVLAICAAGTSRRPAGRERTPRDGRGGTGPWLLLGGLALGLEAVGLALGGRSATVPTLSTVIDHAMAWHGSRFALFCGWLAVAAIPVARRARGTPTWR